MKVYLGILDSSEQVKTPPTGLIVYFKAKGESFTIDNNRLIKKERELINQTELLKKLIKQDGVVRAIFADESLTQQQKIKLTSVLDDFPSIMPIINSKNYDLALLKTLEMLTAKRITQTERDLILSYIYIYCFCKIN
jgi:hypothetical protein